MTSVTPLVTELCRLSPEFHTMWHENSVTEAPVDIVKHIDHPVLGAFAFEHSTFSVDGRPDLTLVVYNPATPADADKLRTVLSHRSEADA